MEERAQISREVQILFERAAAETRLEIRHDRVRSSTRVQDMLRYLPGHLYDSTLDVTRWKSACNIRGNSIEQRFREDLGCSPYRYLSRLRLATAARLLLEPGPRVSEIAELVGYKSLAVLSRAFLRHMGMRPTEYRALLGSGAPAKGRRARIAPWRRAVLAREESSFNIKRLRRFTGYYPPERQTSAEGSSRRWSFGSPHYEARKAERIWSAIQRRSALAQITLLRLQPDFVTPALFDLLREKSREEGRRDRRRGLEIAELALLSLDLCAEALGDDLPNREAQGWISAANARRLMLDFIGSDLEFEIAEDRWRQARKPDPLVEAERAFYKAALRRFQRAFKQALDLINRSVEILRRVEDSELLARSLLLRSGIQRDLEQGLQAIPDIEEALGLFDVELNPYLAYTAYSNLAVWHLEQGNLSDAASALSSAKEHAEKVDCPLISSQIFWLDGLLKAKQGLALSAEHYLRKAIKASLQVDEKEYAVVISLDLAILCVRRGEAEEACRLASRALPILEALKFDREALATLTLLRKALMGNALTVGILENVRTFAESLLHHPLLGRAARER